MSNTFGERLNALINDKQIKKVQFAQSIHVDQSYVSQMISGKRMPSDRVVNDICRVYNVNKEWLCNGEDPMYIEPNPDSLDALAAAHNLSNVDKEILKGFLELDDVRRKVVLDMMRGLINTSDTE